MIATRLSELFKEIAEKWGVQMIAHEVMPDHLHLFVSAPPKFSPAKLAQLFKGTTSYILRLEFPEIKQVIWQAHFGRPAIIPWDAGTVCGNSG